MLDHFYINQCLMMMGFRANCLISIACSRGKHTSLSNDCTEIRESAVSHIKREHEVIMQESTQ